MIVDGHMPSHTTEGETPLHMHVIPGTGHHDSDDLMNAQEATEFMRRLMTVLMFHTEEMLVPDGQKQRVLECMQKSHPKQWKTMRECEAKQHGWDLEHCCEKDGLFHPEFSVQPTEDE